MHQKSCHILYNSSNEFFSSEIILGLPHATGAMSKILLYIPHANLIRRTLLSSSGIIMPQHINLWTKACPNPVCRSRTNVCWDYQYANRNDSINGSMRKIVVVSYNLKQHNNIYSTYYHILSYIILFVRFEVRNRLCNTKQVIVRT